MNADAAFDPRRFVDAQDADGTLTRALSEIRAGSKHTHWMWFVFPQLAGLGRSETARHFALPSLAAARAYAAHDVLGQRLLACTTAALTSPAPSAQALFGTVDAMKFRSSMTLFACAVPDVPVFDDALARYFDGARDPLTLALVGDD